MNFACKFPFLFIFFVKFSRTFWCISYEGNKKHDIFCPTDTGQTNPSGKETLFGGRLPCLRQIPIYTFSAPDVFRWSLVCTVDL